LWKMLHVGWHQFLLDSFNKSNGQSTKVLDQMVKLNMVSKAWTRLKTGVCVCVCVCFTWALSLHLTNPMLKLSNVHALHLQKQMGYVHFASLEPQPSSMPTVPRNTAFMAASTSGRNQLQQAGTTLSLSILSGTPRYK
jgi:hypothetical protein